MISFSQGAAWKALISRYIGTMPPRCNAVPVEHSVSGGPPPKCVSNAITAKVGAAASDSQPATPVAAAPVASLAHGFAPASFRNAASPASDTSTHFLSGAASAT